MLLLLSGSSGSGKTTLARMVGSLVPDLAVHELGELADEPWGGNPRWRHELTERWVRRALEVEANGGDLLVTEVVFGEVLAAPSAARLEGIAACLVDCADEERLRRIRALNGGAEHDPHRLWDFVAWGVWLRFHTSDPQFFSGPIRGDGSDDWHWDRWTGWQQGDPRWQVFRLDTTGEPPERSAGRLATWIGEQRDLLKAGELPLSGRWWEAETAAGA